MPTVTLRPMTPADFEAWKTPTLIRYARTVQVRVGLPDGDAAAAARSEFEQLLPRGLSTPGARLTIVVDDSGRDVGVLWWGVHPRRPDAAYVFDLEIAAQHRGRGHGRAAMLAMQSAARAAGFTAVGLNVTGGNATARALYYSLGYQVQSLAMLLALDG